MVRLGLCVGFVLLLGSGGVEPARIATTRPATSQEGQDQAAGTRIAPWKLRLVTYNVCHCRRNLTKIAEFLRGENADVIFLQEVSRANKDRGIPSQAAQIAKLLGGYVVVDADALGLASTQSCDTAILAKLPLEKGGVCVRSKGGHAFAVHARLEIDGASLHLFSVHMKSTFRLDSDHLLETTNRRLAQTQSLLDHVRELEGDVIAAGDFNVVSWMPEYHGLTKVLTDLGASLKRTDPTFPRWRPTARIDYVFARGSIAAKAYGPREARWSDHKPVVAVVEWSPAARVGHATSQGAEQSDSGKRSKAGRDDVTQPLDPPRR